MLTIGDRFPEFRLKGVVSADPAVPFETFDNASFPGDWKVFVFYPKDFTFVCPTELVGFGKLQSAFADRDVRLFAVSTDNEFVHLAWRRDHTDLRTLPFPMLSDIRRDLSTALGVLDPDELVCMRATFVVDPQGVIRHVSVYDGSVGRNPDEVLRTIDALQTDELCPCNWKNGEATIQVGV